MTPFDRVPEPHDIICLSTIDWDFIWQGHQEIMATLAARGHQVLFVENTGVRSPTLRDLPRLRNRIRNWWRGTKGFRQDRPSLTVYSPLVLPLPYSRVARTINRFLMLRALRRWMRASQFGRPIIWTFLPTPTACDLIRALDPVLVIYYCIDDLASSSRPARRIAASEARLLQEADLVFVTSEKLREHARRFRTQVDLFPFGVNVSRFERTRDEASDVPADMRDLKRPIVGYIGGLHQWVDQKLVADVAQRVPDATFAFVGPVQEDVSALERVPNVRLLGAKSHTELPDYVKAFDVGIVPYRLSEYTANVYPTKLNEYLIMGIPVVATPLEEIRRFNRDEGDLVATAGDAEAFACATRAALGRPRADGWRARIDAARRNSWEQRIDEMWALVEAALAARRTASPRWEVTLRRLYHRATWRSLEIAAVVLSIYLALFQTPLIWWLATPLRLERAPVRADAVVVFAGGVGESGQAGGGYQERVKRAIDLYRQGYAPSLVFSSGFVFAFQEADVMRELAVANGVPSDVITLEKQGTNTYEMVRNARDLLRARGSRRVLLVSSPYHMRRAIMTWSRGAPDIEVVPNPVAESQFYMHDRGASLEQMRGILHEYLAILVYRLRGLA
jgi:glycosyltransferase involved in cell wall biosynthesis/uncharacterized SAM-binding protein YcdF (DUF218 family)